MELVIVAQWALPCLRWQGENVSFEQAPQLLACFPGEGCARLKKEVGCRAVIRKG